MCCNSLDGPPTCIGPTDRRGINRVVYGRMGADSRAANSALLEYPGNPIPRRQRVTIASYRQMAAREPCAAPKVHLRRPRTGPSAAAATIACIAGWGASVAETRCGRCCRTSRRESPLRVAIPCPAWQANLAARGSPGTGLAHVDHRPWVRSRVVTGDLEGTCPGWCRVRRSRKSCLPGGLHILQVRCIHILLEARDLAAGS